MFPCSAITPNLWYLFRLFLTSSSADFFTWWIFLISLYVRTLMFRLRTFKWVNSLFVYYNMMGFFEGRVFLSFAKKLFNLFIIIWLIFVAGSFVYYNSGNDVFCCSSAVSNLEIILALFTRKICYVPISMFRPARIFLSFDQPSSFRACKLFYVLV